MMKIVRIFADLVTQLTPNIRKSPFSGHPKMAEQAATKRAKHYRDTHSLNNSRSFLFCQETSQLTSTRLLSFVTGRGESKSCSRENVLL